MDKLQRLIKLDELLRSKSGMTYKEIIEALEMDYDNPSTARRIVQYDLVTLRDTYGMEFDSGRRKGRQTLHRYADTECKSKFGHVITEQERDKYELAERVRLEKRNLDFITRNSPHNAWLQLYIDAIEVGDTIRSRNAISFDNNPQLQGIDKVRTLLAKIVEQKAIRFMYQGFGREAHEVVCHPYHLKQHNNRWFLLCLSESRRDIRNYAVDRIAGDIVDAEIGYKRSNEDWQRYFKDLIGVTKYSDAERKKLYDVVLRVRRARYDYIKTKPFHATQTEVPECSNEEYAAFKIRVMLNPELESLILSYGNDIEVLGPQELREKIKDRAAKMYEMYR